MSFLNQVSSLYSREPHHILPFVGSAFKDAQSGLLRVVVVGINTYVSSKDWEAAGRPTGATWFSGWFANGEHRFYPRVKREAHELTSGLTERQMFGGRVVDPLESYYATNAIKVHVQEARGKQAHQITNEMFNQHTATWRQELDLMAEHGVLPHVIAIVGKPFWGRANESLTSTQSYQHLRVMSSDTSPGPCLHYVRRLRLAGSAGEQDALLVRIRHPSARTKKGSARWLLGHLALPTVPSPATDDRPDAEEIAKHKDGEEFFYRGRQYMLYKGLCRRVFPPPPGQH